MSSPSCEQGMSCTKVINVLESLLQEIIPCDLRLTWLPGHPLKVKHSCAARSHAVDDGSGAESGSAAVPADEKGVFFQ